MKEFKRFFGITDENASSSRSSSATSSSSPSFIPSDRKNDLETLQTAVNNSMLSINAILRQRPPTISQEDRAGIDAALSDYQNAAQPILACRTRYFTDAVWKIKTDLADDLKIRYQVLLLALNAALTKQLNAVNAATAIPSSVDFQAIFNDKETVYGLLDSSNRASIAQAEKSLFITWNTKLSQEARGYFALSNKSEISQNRGNLIAVFNAKQIVARNLHTLEYPDRKYEVDYFLPLFNAIAGLKNYLTHEETGRYTKPGTFFGFGFFGAYSRATKLNDTLKYCDTIVLNVKGDPLPSRTGSLNQGKLYGVIELFIGNLKSFFEIVKTPGNTKKVPSSRAAPPEVPRVTSTSPVGFAEFINSILGRSVAVTMAPSADSIPEKCRNSLIRDINDYNGRTSSTVLECSSLVGRVANLICQSAYYKGGADDLSDLLGYQQYLVAQAYQFNPPASVMKFMKSLVTYAAEKYQGLDPRLSADKSKLLAVLHCVDILMKDKVPEATLSTHLSSAMFNSAFNRQGIFDDYVRTFVQERNAEKAQEARRGACENSMALNDHQRREEAAAAAASDDRGSRFLTFRH